MDTKYEYYTTDKTPGKKMMPSNWVHRIAGWTSTMDSGRLHFNNALVPYICNDFCCLRVDREKLQKDFPELYDSVITLVTHNNVRKITL